MSLTRWPVRLNVLPGERLSSWLRRTGMIYGCSVDDLLKYDLNLAQLKAADLDMTATAELLTAVSARTGVPADAIKKMTFPATVPFLFSGSPSDLANFPPCSVLWKPSNGNQVKLSRWLRWFRKESRHRVNACRLCLADYPNAGIALPWAVSIVLSCPFHGVMLETAHTDRRSIKFTDDVTPAPALISALDHRTWTAVTTGYVKLPGGLIYAGLWFRLLYAIFTELNESPFETVQGKFQWAIWEAAGYFPSYEFFNPFRFDKTCAALIAVAIDQLEKGLLPAKGTHAYLFQK